MKGIELFYRISYDIDQIDRNGYNKDGINCLGYDKRGYNKKATFTYKTKHI